MKDDLSDWGDPERNGHKNGDKKWRLTKEKIFMSFGLAIICASFINSELFAGSFHYEYLIVGLALCGISITQWGDKK